MHLLAPSAASRGTWRLMLRRAHRATFFVFIAALVGAAARAQTWQGTDIGSPPTTGSDSVSNGVYTLTGSGEGEGGINKPPAYRGDLGVAGYSDQFHFYSTALDDNSQIVARIASLTMSTGTGAPEAGVTIRTDLTASAENVAAYQTSGSTRIAFRAPPYSYSYMDHATQWPKVLLNTSLPMWVKLLRSSGGVMAYTSSDGLTWTEQDWQTVPLATPAYAGLFVAGGGFDAVATATFDHVSVGAATPLPAPLAPTDLVVAESGLNYATLTWTNREPHIERLELQRSTDGVNFTAVAPWSKNFPTTFKDEVLDLHTTYTFRLAVIRGTQTSYSNTVTVTTPDLTLQTDQVWATRVTLRWSTTASPSTSFYVLYSTDQSYWQVGATVDASARSAAVDFLDPSKTYYFTVGSGSQFNILNPGQYSNVVSATTTTTPPPGSPAAPTNLALTSFDGAANLYFAWTDNSSDETGFVLEYSNDGTNYYRAPVAGSRWTYTIAANTTTAIASPNIGYDKPGYLRIRSYNANGTSLPTDPLTVTIPWVEPPSGLHATVVSSNEVDLDWTDNSNNETGFEVQRAAPNEANFVRIGTVPANTTHYADTTAAAGTHYTYRVRSLIGIGGSPSYTVTDATTPGTAPNPNPPWAASSITPTPGYLNLARTIEVQLGFTAPVIVTGTPSVTVTIGGSSRQATYVSGSGTSWLVFHYTTATGDNGSVSFVSPINLNGGTIRGTDGTAARVDFPTIDRPTLIIDTIPPAAAVITSVTQSNTPVFTGTADPGVSVRVSDDPYGNNHPAGSTTAGSDGKWTLTWQGSPLPPGTYHFTAVAMDPAGNTSPYSNEVVVTVPGAGKTGQTITFASPTGAVRVGTPITLGALSSAGLPITYSIVSGDATLSGNVLTPQSTATLIVRASSPGDATYAAASTDVNFGNPIPVGNSRLVNISSRLRVSAGDADGATVAGFYVTGTTPKTILIRAVGPSLRQFGIANPISTPLLTLYNNQNALIATNSGWGDNTAIAQASTKVGAFPLATGSSDAALLYSLQPGQYTARVQSAASGTVLIEVYDVGSTDPNPTKQLINISTRGYVGAGADVLIGGFVVAGDAPKRILIRGVGPGLAQFGVANVVGNPVLQVFDGHQNLVAQNDDWETPQPVGGSDAPATAAQITAADTSAGAFPLQSGSKDAAVIATLPPGQYTAIISGVNNGTGSAIVEVYELP